MSTSQLPPPSVQEAILLTNLNNVLLQVLFLGVYTVTYFGTLYAYLTKKSLPSKTVVGSITLLYICYITQTCADWYELKLAFINEGQTRDSIFAAMLPSPGWETLTVDIASFLQAVLADGLVIWRCFHVWGRSLKAILLPSFFLFSESVLYLTIIVLVCADHLNPSNSQGQILNQLISASCFITLATTASATILIAYRIVSVSKQEVLHGSRARFRHVLVIIVESAAAYSVVALAYALTGVIPYTESNLSPLFAAQGYIFIFFYFTAGVAPTIMVARVALVSSRDEVDSAVTHISGLRFQPQSSAANTTGLTENNDETENAGSELPHESEKWETKEGKERRSV